MIRGSFIDKVISIFYPDTCPYCLKTIGNTQLKCEDCEKNIEYIFHQRDVDGETKCLSVFLYSGKVRDAVRRFKFSGYKRYGWNFAKEIIKAFDKENINHNFSKITFVPVYKFSKNKRAYNQAQVLANEISLNLGKIPVEDILEKIKNNKPQHSIKNYKERENNVKGVYRAKKYFSQSKGRILLCDDIITSGNTLKECTKVLKEAGYKDILCVTVASAQRL